MIYCNQRLSVCRFKQANNESCGSCRRTHSRVPKDMLTMPTQWIYNVLINLIVLSLVWGTVLSGLILVVRDKVDDDDLAQYR